MLEWYRPGFDHHDLMDEVDLLLNKVVDAGEAERETYEGLFQHHVGANPHRADAAELERAGRAHGVTVSASSSLSREDWLNLLMAQVIEPKLGQKAPMFVYDYPADLGCACPNPPGRPGGGRNDSRSIFGERNLQTATTSLRTLANSVSASGAISRSGARWVMTPSSPTNGFSWRSRREFRLRLESPSESIAW